MSEKAMHQPFEHMAEGADTAILFVHGILGTPHHFRDFLPLVPKERSVCNLLLDGHGGTADDFARSSMQKWQAQVSEKLEELKRRHDRILIVAHSMGTLFAISEAIKDPERIKGMFFLATPLRIWVHPRLVPSMIKVYFNAYKPSDAVCVAYRESCSIENYKYVWRYLRWIPRYLELFSEATRVRRLLPELQVPCRVFQSGRDEMVSHATVKDLQGHPHIRLQVCPIPCITIIPPRIRRPSWPHFPKWSRNFHKKSADASALFLFYRLISFSVKAPQKAGWRSTARRYRAAR